MANILEYLDWRGDLSLKKDKFNEIDNVILARLSYFPFESVMKKGESLSIYDINEKFKKVDQKKVTLLNKNDIELINTLASTERFKGSIISDFVNKVSIEEEKQFSAITIHLPDNTLYISYRGTDNTIIGWKEDFNLSFMDNIPSQKSAVKYLESAANLYEGKIRVGGHSKGGNLSVYAACFCDESIKRRIIDVYNNDGPGFSEKITVKNEYKSMLKKVSTFIPKSSIVGRLLNHEEKTHIIDSTGTGILQHDVYSWQLLGNSFIHLEKLTNDSQIIDESITSWLASIEVEKRKKFVDVLFEILLSSEAKTVPAFTKNILNNSKTLFNTYKNIDEESKKNMSELIKELLIIFKDNITKTYFVKK